jgi:Protein of unknown function (DUF4038)/Putative collagen-binding domain of a collagenase
MTKICVEHWRRIVLCPAFLLAAFSGCASTAGSPAGSDGAGLGGAGHALAGAAPGGASGSSAAAATGGLGGASYGGELGAGGSSGGAVAGAGSSEADAGGGGTSGSSGIGGGGAGNSAAGSAGSSGTGRLQASADGRYLQWSNGTPIFLLSDTTWLLPARYTLAEVTAHAKTRAAQGFTALQMTASFPENGYQALDTVFTASDFTRPVASYWSALDEKIKVITDAGLVVILNPFWKKTSDATISSNGSVKCRAYGKWLATRYRDNARVAYFLGGDSSPGTVRDQLDAMGLGIQDAYKEAGLPPAIVAYHGAPAHSSRVEWPTNPSWLTLDWTYAYSLPLGADVPYQMNQADWPKKPPIPIMFGEGWYDRDNGATTASRFGNRQMVRRQLWWNPLSGAIAGTAYGAEPIWFHGYKGFTPAQAVLWDSGLDAARMKTFLYTTQWWRLHPDLDHSFIVAGNAAPGAVDYAVGAVADDNSFAVAYTPTARSLTLRMPTGKDFKLRWFDPSNGSYRAGSTAGPSGASVVMTHPGNNASGAADWVIHVSQ